ncbi:MAG: hypothetical protein IJV01_07385 [Bacteroidales bacterium]|nr:hypothetical protein [Bacteroidales bacterium]
MKKYCILFLAALMGMACTVDSTYTSSRSKANLADLGYVINGWATDGVVRLMNEYALDDKVDIFAPGFDKTADTQNKLSVRIIIDPSEDSLWTISNADPASVVRFDAQLKMLPSDKKEKPTDIERHRWRYTVVGQYVEPGGNGVDFCDLSGLEFYWFPYIVSVLEGTEYMLMESGKFRLETFMGTNRLDWCELRFQGEKGYDYNAGTL